MPLPLQPLPKPADYDERVRALEARGWTATAMQVQNDRGFARKDASIASAVLYTLVPAGSLIMVPDSVWTHELWAAHLVGAAPRGCHVYVIAPALPNAPSAGAPQMSRTREVFSRFLEIQAILGPELEARGGRLRVGLVISHRPLGSATSVSTKNSAAPFRTGYARARNAVSPEYT